MVHAIIIWSPDFFPPPNTSISFRNAGPNIFYIRIEKINTMIPLVSLEMKNNV